MIELLGVSKSYGTPFGRKVVLDSVDARFEPNVSVGILGRNGAGKSTLMRIIGGAQQADYGVVRREGRVSWPLGYAGGLAGAITGEANCRMVARMYGADPDDIAEFARGFADIGEYFLMPVSTYSSGMKARVAFGLSMALDFDFYLVDESIGAGDSRFAVRCRNAFRERADRSAVILVSHSLGTVHQWCRQYAVLNAGHLDFYENFNIARLMYERGSR